MPPAEVIRAVSSGNVILPAGNVRTGELNRMVPSNSVVKDIKDLLDLPNPDRHRTPRLQCESRATDREAGSSRTGGPTGGSAGEGRGRGRTRAEAEAQLAADESAYQKLEAASRTPGVVAGNDLVVAEKSAEADGARMRAAQQAVLAAKSSLRSVAEMERYLEIKAPFDGVITERNVHPGALVEPAGGAAVPIVRIEKMSRLRLVVAVPEIYVGGIPQRTRVSFSVPAYPGRLSAAPSPASRTPWMRKRGPCPWNSM